uniref:DksA C4-type domain-containing protein n=1 Tax=viral metagenome TaxID=1070528 RepID=A0A6C0IDT0_9ZZZZ
MNHNLLLKNKYQNILNNINEIIYIYNEIKNYNIQNNLNDTITEEIQYYEEKYKELSNSILYINSIIYKECQHNYIDDEIDITPELSQRITYCTLCEHTL